MRILDLQAQNVGIQQEAFRQRYEAGYLKERRDNDKWLSQLSRTMPSSRCRRIS
jgi:hypothetical protein